MNLLKPHALGTLLHLTDTSICTQHDVISNRNLLPSIQTGETIATATPCLTRFQKIVASVPPRNIFTNHATLSTKQQTFRQVCELFISRTTLVS